MTSAADREEEFEAFLWRRVAPAFGDRAEGAAVVAEAMASAGAWAKASRRVGPGAPAAPKKPPAVHYAGTRPGTAACRPGDRADLNGWALTGDPEAVTCGHCRKTTGLAARETAGATE